MNNTATRAAGCVGRSGGTQGFWRQLSARFDDVSLGFDTVSYGLAVLELSEYQRIALTFWFSSLYLPSARASGSGVLENTQ